MAICEAYDVRVDGRAGTRCTHRMVKCDYCNWHTDWRAARKLPFRVATAVILKHVADKHPEHHPNAGARLASSNTNLAKD